MNTDARLEDLRRAHESDPENGQLALAYEQALRRAGRADDADKIRVPTEIKGGREAAQYIHTKEISR